jgi:hypothetical protein
MRGLEPLEDVGQQIGADGQRGGDGDGPGAGRPQVVHRLTRQRDGVQQLLGVRAQCPPGRGERHARLAPLEQRDAQRLFEGLDAGADGGLGDPQGVGGAAKAAEGPHRQEGLNLRNFHPKDSFMAGLTAIRFDYTRCESSF